MDIESENGDNKEEMGTITAEILAEMQLPIAASKKRRAHMKVQNPFAEEDEAAEREKREILLVEKAFDSDESDDEIEATDPSSDKRLKSTRNKAKKDPQLMPLWMKDFTLIGKESVSVSEFSQKHKLNPIIATNLARMGITSLFSVQVSLIPKVISAYKLGGDSLVRAPTGSGKTLAYAIPIVHLLSTRVIQRIRALVIVPTRDLANQVHSVFEKYSFT